MTTLLKGWKIRDSSKEPFKSFTVSTPQGCVAVVRSHGVYLEDVLYQLLEALDKEQRKPAHHKTELAKRLEAKGYELDRDNPFINSF